jgi:hypothetical protein
MPSFVSAAEVARLFPGVQMTAFHLEIVPPERPTTLTRNETPSANDSSEVLKEGLPSLSFLFQPY